MYVVHTCVVQQQGPRAGSSLYMYVTQHHVSQHHMPNFGLGGSIMHGHHCITMKCVVPEAACPGNCQRQLPEAISLGSAVSIGYAL
jgi:hypothetical protein